MGYDQIGLGSDIQMTTLRDIAQKIGVDVSTVSKVLQGKPIRVSPDKRERIHRVAKELNYRPNSLAQGLRLKRSGAIAMPIPSLTNYLFPEIISGAQEAADQAGLVLLLLKQAVDGSGIQLISLIEHGRVDGLLFADDAPTPDYLTTLRDLSIPYITMNRTKEKEDRFVILNDLAGFDLQAAFLAEQGHKVVGFVKVRPASFTALRCEAQFVASTASRGLICPESHRLPCDFEGNGYQELIQSILSLDPRPTAVATASVIVATRLVEGFRKHGISVPADIGVIGYHDSPVAQWPPPGVTTVRMPSRVQGHRAVEALAKVIAGEEFEGEVVALAPDVIDRGTCLPPGCK